MSSYAEDRPWLSIPNPFGFEPLYEQVKHIYQSPPRGYSKPKGVKQRTAPLGRDWLGAGFQKGDVVQGTVSGTTELLVVEEIFLDDGKGQPYTWNTHLVLQKSSGRILQAVNRWNYNGSQRQHTLEIQPVEMSWIGNHLGLVSLNSSLHQGLDDDYVALAFQTFRVRCKPLVNSKWTTNAKRSLTQGQVTVIGQDSDRSLLELRLNCRDVPLMGEPDSYILGS